MDQCAFCRILTGKLKAFIVLESERVVAFLDHNPVNDGHTLVVPRRHVAAFTELTAVEGRELFAAAQFLGRMCLEALHAPGVNYMINQGEAAGQRVFHVHCHILPRYKQDGLVFGRKEGVAPDEALRRVHDKLSDYCREHPFSPVCER